MHLLDNYTIDARTRYENHTLIYTAADSDMIALFQTKGGKEIRYAAEFRVHLAVGIVVATGGILGGTVLGEIEIRESELVPVIADRLRKDI